MRVQKKHLLVLFTILSVLELVNLQNTEQAEGSSNDAVKKLEKNNVKKSVDVVKSLNKKIKTGPKEEKKVENLKVREKVKIVEEVKKPNIVFILVDDVGYADFNYNTPAKSPIPTPHIDALAQQG